MIAIASTAVLFLFFILAKAVKEEKRYILIIRCEADAMEYVKSVTYRYLKSPKLTIFSKNCMPAKKLSVPTLFYRKTNQVCKVELLL